MKPVRVGHRIRFRHGPYEASRNDLLDAVRALLWAQYAERITDEAARRMELNYARKAVSAAIVKLALPGTMGMPRLYEMNVRFQVMNFSYWKDVTDPCPEIEWASFARGVYL